MTHLKKSKPIIVCTTFRQDEETPLPKIALTAAYVDAVLKAGGMPVMLPSGLAEDDVAAVLAAVDGVMLPGGGDVHPSFYQEPLSEQIIQVDLARDQIETTIVRIAVERRLPLLGICRGLQVLNVALGGTLWADVLSQKPGRIAHDFDQTYPRQYRAHSVEVEQGSLLAQVLGCTETAVNSLHHQGIKALAPDLRSTAIAPDGLIEGVEIPGHPFAVGVQWHPEWLVDESVPMMNLFNRFVQAARNGR